MSPRTANFLLLFAAAVWGVGFIAQVTGMEDIGPFMFTGLRFLLAGVVILPFAWREQRKAKNRISFSDIKTLLPLGLAFFSGLVLQQIGLQTTSVTNAGFLTALYVIFVPIILFFVLREKQPWIIWPAALLALTGIFLLSGGELSGLVLGDWLVIGGGIFGAIHLIMIGKIGKASGVPFTMASIQFLISGILGICCYFIAPFLGVIEPAISWESIRGALPEVFYAGVFSGALAFSLMAVAQQYTNEAAAAILMSSESLFAALFAWLLLNEQLETVAYFGCGLIFAALLLVQLMPSLLDITKSKRSKITHT